MSHDHCHSHDQKNEDSCCSSGHEESSSCCHHGDSHEHHDDFARQLLEMADEAWMEVLHEKIKERIITLNGAHLDKLASVIAEANHARWKNKMAGHKDCHSFKDKINELLNCQ